MHQSMKIQTLLLMAGLHFVAMYILMYAMVDQLSNALPNLNQFYMAGIMTAPMLMIEVALMRSMYPNKKALYATFAVSLLVFGSFLFFIRRQTAITDQEFLRSMIPHHAGAILMCDQAKLQDPEIKELCEGIRASQQSEIDFMKAKLE